MILCRKNREATSFPIRLPTGPQSSGFNGFERGSIVAIFAAATPSVKKGNYEVADKYVIPSGVFSRHL
jgi:hypothetical protein